MGGNKFMPKMHLKQPVFSYSACGPFTKNKTTTTKRKEFKNLCRQEIQIIFVRMILIKLVFNMIWLMVNIKIDWKNKIREIFEI